jgi:hypothetical protein
MATPIILVVVGTLPKLHNDGLFGITSDPSKMALTLALVVKPPFLAEFVFKKYLVNQLLNVDMVILRIL